MKELIKEDLKSKDIKPILKELPERVGEEVEFIPDLSVDTLNTCESCGDPISGRVYHYGVFDVLCKKCYKQKKDKK